MSVVKQLNKTFNFFRIWIIICESTCWVCMNILSRVKSFPIAYEKCSCLVKFYSKSFLCKATQASFLSFNILKRDIFWTWRVNVAHVYRIRQCLLKIQQTLPKISVFVVYKLAINTWLYKVLKNFKPVTFWWTDVFVK